MPDPSPNPAFPEEAPTTDPPDGPGVPDPQPAEAPDPIAPDAPTTPDPMPDTAA